MGRGRGHHVPFPQSRSESVMRSRGFMRRLRGVFARLAGWFGVARRERDWAAEFESHFAMHIEDNLRAGMSAEEARREALLKFGGIEVVKESLRDQSSFSWLETSVRDVRYAIRSLGRSPGFAITTILSLTLGLGASLAVFTVADNLLVRPLPYRDASRLVMLWEANHKIKVGGDRNVVAPANYLDWQAQNDVLEGMAALSPLRSGVLTDNGRVEEFGGRSVTAGFFPLLGIRPVRGRLFTAAEARTPSITLISYRLWQTWFGGDEHIIGRKIQVNSMPSTIIGVLPANFHFFDRDTDLWGPLFLNPAEDYRKTSGRWMLSVGRLRPGVTIGQARDHMAALAKRLEEAYPAFNMNWTVTVEPLRDALFRETKTPLLILLAAVFLMLAVACANVANLLLARYSSRTREIAVRASLGAGRWRVIRQLLTESLLLGATGGIVGIALARWAVTGLMVLAPKDLTDSTGIHVDLRIVVFAIALSMLTSIFFGLAPALVTTRMDLVSAFRGDSRSGFGTGRHLRSWLVGAEVALSVILLAGGLLLFRSLAGLESVNSGIDASNVLTFRVTVSPVHYPKPIARTQFVERAIEQLSTLPGVRSVSATNCAPFTGICAGTSLEIEGRPPARPGEQLSATIRTVMPGYFRTLGMPLKSGRDFAPADNADGAPYRFIVNESFARQFLRGEQPLGKRISVAMDMDNPFGEIIGVASDVRELTIDAEPVPTVYYIHSHLSYPRMVFLIRTDRNPLTFTEPARKVIQRLDPEEPLASVQTMESILGENFSRQRFSAWLLGGFAAIALLLAGIGIYGVLAYSVTARTREFGVRAALGANAGRIVALVFRTGMLPVAGGLIAGVAGALALSGLLKSLLFGVGPRDPLTFGVVPLLLAAVALVAALLPARRAARLDPMEALRTE